MSAAEEPFIRDTTTRLKWKDAFPDLPALAKRTDPIFFGGPVRMTGLWYMLRHSRPPSTALPVLDDLYLGADGKFLEDALARGAKFERFFLGYAGWTPEQLEIEIARGAWYVLPADLKSILEMPPEKMWRELLRRATAVEA
jgi:putative transcriptional regulator